VESPVGPVDGYLATRSLTGTRIDAPLEEQPVSVQVLPREIIEDVQATRIEDVVSFAAGAAKDNNFGGLQDNFTLRGLQANVAEDGIVTDNGLAAIPQVRDSASAERVEVLRGPASALYGQGGPGGIVNVVTKRPDAARTFAEITGLYSTFERVRSEFDINAPLLNGFAALRIAGALEARNSFRVDDAFDERWPSDRVFLAPTIVFGQGTDTQLLVRGEYLRDDTPFDRGVSLSPDSGQLTDIEQFLGDPEAGNVTSEKGKVQVDLSHQFSDDWSAQVIGSYLTNTVEGDAIEPRTVFDQELIGLTNFFRQVTVVPGTGGQTLFDLLGPTDIAEGDVLRLFRDRDQDDELLSAQVNVNGVVETGFLTHNLLFSAERQNIDSNSVLGESDQFTALLDAVQNGTASQFILDASDIDLSQGIPGVTTTSFTDETLDTYGATILDKVDVGEQLHLLLGGRYDVIEQTVVRDNVPAGANDPTRASFEVDKFSPRLGAVVEPFAGVHLSFFVSYTEGIRANRADADADNVIAPQESTAYEGGLRYGFLDNRLAFTATVFDIEIENFPVSTIDDVIPSTVESQGVELVLQGQVTPELSLLASYTYTDAVFAEAPDLIEGTQTIGTPEHAASFLANYKFVDGPYRGYFATLGILYQDERVGSAPFELAIPQPGVPPLLIEQTTLPSFVRVDLSAGYEFESGAKLEIGVKNLFDDEILQPSIPGFASPEAPVTGFFRFTGKF
jgi:iron complex outermembrane receptor protein